MQGVLENGKKIFMYIEERNDILDDIICSRRTNMESKKRVFSRTDTKYIKAAAALGLAAVILQVAARRLPGFGQWYAAAVYPVIVRVYARVWSIVPFSGVEVGIYLFLAVWVIYGVRHAREAGRILSRMLFCLTLLLFLFTINCGINYYRRPFSSYLSMGVKKSSSAELRELCRFLTEKVNETVDQSEYDESWIQEARTAMENLGERYPELGGYYPKPKPLLVSRILSLQQLSGIYSPFTVEANFNREMTDYNIPHTICHELSHLKGFMREDEANFIGYLACIGSDSLAFQYSGYLTGWVYATNALARIDMEAYIELYRSLDLAVIEDLQENSYFWNQYEGKAAKVSNQMNDTYLKMNDQTDGVQSYGRMVDLMLGYYREGK